MAVPPVPTLQYLSSNFVVSAGSVLFRQSPGSNDLQICVLYYRKKGEWLLPKGRKDRGERIEAAAVRETFEETGYACELLPCRMPTRAPELGINTPDMVAVVDNITEPIVVTIRDLGEMGMKMIWWFVTRVKSNSAEKVAGTQTESEQFDSHFLNAEEAANRLTFQADRDVVVQALSLVKDTASAKGLNDLFRS